MSILNPPTLKIQPVSHTNTKKLSYELRGPLELMSMTVTLLPRAYCDVLKNPSLATDSRLKIELGGTENVSDIPAIIEALRAVQSVAATFPTRIIHGVSEQV